MNCQKFEGIVSELARERIMSAGIRQDALAHSGECAHCALRLRNEEMLTGGLQAFASDTKSAQAPARIEQQLLDAFRQRRALRPASVTKSRGRYWLSAAAAVLLIVASVLAIRWSFEKPSPQSSTPAQAVNQKTRENALEVDNIPKYSEQGIKQPVATIGPKHGMRARRAQVRPADAAKPPEAVANHVTKEIATEFMPLGYLNAVNLQDGGQIVRVELPRSTMASFGLPVNMDRYNERVKADVLLGVDGVAHAIRFVQ
jgi:hypothetical protein